MRKVLLCYASHALKGTNRNNRNKAIIIPLLQQPITSKRNLVLLPPRQQQSYSTTTNTTNCSSPSSSCTIEENNNTKKNQITVLNHPLQTIRVGDYALISKTFTEEHVQQFAQLVGDFNPVHFDEQFVHREMNGIFAGKVVHGILMGALISTVAGTILPGPGSVYLSQTFNFVKPAYMNDTLTARVECKKALNKKGNVFLFETVVSNEKTGEVLISGEAKVYHPKLTLATHSE